MRHNVIFKISRAHEFTLYKYEQNISFRSVELMTFHLTNQIKNYAWTIKLEHNHKHE